MRKFGILVLMLALAAAVQAQEKKSLGSLMARNNILNHVDVGVGVGTTGISIERGSTRHRLCPHPHRLQLHATLQHPYRLSH